MNTCKFCDGKKYKQIGHGAHAVVYACEPCKEQVIKKKRRRIATKRSSSGRGSLAFYANSEFAIVNGEKVRVG